MVQQNKWKLMLVDFGFARALEKEEIEIQTTKRLRNSIVFERESVHANLNSSALANSIAAAAAARIRTHSNANPLGETSALRNSDPNLTTSRHL